MLCRLACVDASGIAKPSEQDIPELCKVLCIADQIRIRQAHTVNALRARCLAKVFEDIVRQNDLRLSLSDLFEHSLKRLFCDVIVYSVNGSSFAQVDIDIQSCINVSHDPRIIQQVKIRSTVIVIISDHTILADCALQLRLPIAEDADELRAVAVLIERTDPRRIRSDQDPAVDLFETDRARDNKVSLKPSCIDISINVIVKHGTIDPEQLIKVCCSPHITLDTFFLSGIDREHEEVIKVKHDLSLLE